MQTAARSRASLGVKTLDYLETQIRRNTIDDFSAKLAASSTDAEVMLGEIVENGPVAVFLKAAPVKKRPAPTFQSKLITVSVERAKVAELKRWLDLARKNLSD